jgi:hypothetical protein
MDRTSFETLFRPIGAGLVVLLTILLLLGTAIRDPRPHDIPIGIAAPPPVAQQLTAAFGQNAPGAFAFTTYPSEAEARTAVDGRSVVASLIVGPGGPTLVVAQAAGDAVTGAVTAALTAAFQAQGQQLTVQTVHPLAAGDSHGIVLFFLVLATLISSVAAGALTLFGMPGASRPTRVGVLALAAISISIVGPATATWLTNGYGDGIWAAMAILSLASFAVGATIAAFARWLGAQGAALGVVGVVLLGLVSSGGPLGRAFLPDAYRAIAPWLPVEPTIEALKGVLFFGGAGIGTSLIVLTSWAVAAVVVLTLGRVRAPVADRAAVAHA